MTSHDPGDPDPYNLARFVDAQADSYERALVEIRSGHKVTHWMWYVFPQLAGLGRSATAQKFAVRSLDEARAYLAHPILGPRLIACADAALSVKERSALEIFGSPDERKLQSCATLFARVAPKTMFAQLLDRFYQGRRDDATERLLGRGG